MRKLFLILVVSIFSFTLVSTSSALVSFSGNFDAENRGNGVLNSTGFNQWDEVEFEGIDENKSDMLPDNVLHKTSQVPEPATMLLLGTGLLGLGLWRKKNINR